MPTPLFHSDTAETTVVQHLVTQFSFCAEWQSIYPACCRRSRSDGPHHLLSHVQLGAILVVPYIFCGAVPLLTCKFAAGGIVIRCDICANKFVTAMQQGWGGGDGRQSPPAAKGRNVILYRSIREVASSRHPSSLVHGRGRNHFGRCAEATQFVRR